MTFSEFDEQIRWLKACWPGTRAYLAADDTFGDFAGLPADAARTAARALFAEGRAHAPSLSEWLARSRTVLSTKPVTATEQGSCDRHRWAIVEYRDEEGMRAIMCVVCHEERTVSSSTVRSVSEIEDARR